MSEIMDAIRKHVFMSAAEAWNGRELKVHALTEKTVATGAKFDALRIKISTFVPCKGMLTLVNKDRIKTIDKIDDHRIAYCSIVNVAGDKIRISRATPCQVVDREMSTGYSGYYRSRTFTGTSITSKNEILDLCDPKLMDVIDERLQTFFEAVK